MSQLTLNRSRIFKKDGFSFKKSIRKASSNYSLLPEQLDFRIQKKKLIEIIDLENFFAEPIL